MDIFIIREGRQTGPFSSEAVKAQLTEGSARPTDMGWRKGMAEWRPLSEVLKVASDLAASPSADGHATNGAPEKRGTASAKQKVFLKYLGAEFDEGIARERAALAISDALENPKLQPRIRKWQDEKLRMHADVFQDEIDYRRANRSNRYLERIQTEGSEVLKDVTKAHVQVLVESLDKRHPGWENDRQSALWEYLLPAVGEHFPQLVQPDYKHRLNPGGSGVAKGGSGLTRSTLAAAGVSMPPPARSSTLGAMLRGVVLGVVTLGAIIAGHHYWQQSHSKGGESVAGMPGPVAPAKSETPPAPAEPAAKEPAAPAPDKRIAEAKAPDGVPENPPAPAPAPAPVAPIEPAATPPPPVAAEKPATPMAAEKPAAPEEKPAAPAPAVPATPPAPTEPPAATPPPAAPAAPRAAVKLIQGIGVMLQNGQVTLPAGTQLRYLGTEGANIRVSWNNSVFFVPAAATDINEPQPAPPAPSATPPAPGNPDAGAMTPAIPPATPAAAKPKKPSDDL
jgi:hypothetical protein